MADNKDDFISFESALGELRLSEEQLKRLVSEGEIRAIRGDQNTMRFRRDEIERLKQDTGKTIQYTEESSDTLTDDLLFDESDDLQVEDEGMATAQISSEDTFIADDTGMTTAPITSGGPVRSGGRGSRTGGVSGGGKRGGKASKPAAAEPKKRKPSAAPTATSSRSGVTRTTGRSTRIRSVSAEQEASGIGMGMSAVLIIGFLLGCYALMIWWDTANDRVTDATRGVVNFAGENFGGIAPKEN